MTFKLDLWPIDHMNIYEGSHIISMNQRSLVQIRLQLLKWGHFQPNLQLDLRWPLTLVYDLWPHEHYEGSHIISINQVSFKSDLKVDVPILTCIFFTFNWLTLTSEMHFVKFYPEVASCLLSRGKRKYAPLGMRLLWKYIRNYFLVYHLIW